MDISGIKVNEPRGTSAVGLGMVVDAGLSA